MNKKASFIKGGEMKRYLLLFAILITAVFFYPVFAHAKKIEAYFMQNPISEPATLLFLGSGLLIAASLTKRLVKN